MAAWTTINVENARKKLAGKTCTILDIEDDETAVTLKIACGEDNYLLTLAQIARPIGGGL